MEKIKQALEKARKEREGTSDSMEAPTPPPPAPDLDADEGKSINYTRTRVLPGAGETMREHRLITSLDNSPYTEAVRIMGTQVLKRMEENGWSSIMVASPRTKAGTTTMTLNLGLSIARQIDYTVLTVDANLRTGLVHEYFGFPQQKGLSDYLSGDLELQNVLVNPRGVGHFVILPSGTPASNAPELLRSPKMASLTSELTSRYPKRIIIFDVPSVLDTAEALSLASYVDCVLLVVEDDETKQTDLNATIEMLSDANIIGTVLNKAVSV